MNNYKTRPIGEIFEYCKLELQVVESENCDGCFFWGDADCLNYRRDTGYCGDSMRNDDKNVIFKQIDK